MEEKPLTEEPQTEESTPSIPQEPEVLEQTPEETTPEAPEPQTEELTPTQEPVPTPPPTPQPTQPSQPFIQTLLAKARAAIQTRKQKKLDKIMSLFDTQEQITNKDAQKLLRISRTTAFRYFNILEKQNKIKQVGNTGKSVFYTKI